MNAGKIHGPWAAVGKDGKCLDCNNWRAVSEDNGESQYQPIHDARGAVIALVVARSSSPWGSTPDTCDVAALIASAPDLLAERDRLKAVNAELVEALEAAQQAIDNMKNEAETAAQGDEQMLLDAAEAISNTGLEADIAIRAALEKHQGEAK